MIYCFHPETLVSDLFFIILCNVLLGFNFNCVSAIGQICMSVSLYLILHRLLKMHGSPTKKIVKTIKLKGVTMVYYVIL